MKRLSSENIVIKLGGSAETWKDTAPPNVKLTLAGYPALSEVELHEDGGWAGGPD